jgi:hypothetical protein
MTIDTLSFYVNEAGISRLLPVVEIATSVVRSMSSPPDVVQQTPAVDSMSSLPAAYPGARPALESSSPSIGSNILCDPPPSPTTAYCADYDAYHFVGIGDFSLHEISRCGDPRGGSAAIYPTVSECQRALDALTLHSTPYDVNYVEGLYSDYPCSDDDSYHEAKGQLKNPAAQVLRTPLLLAADTSSTPTPTCSSTPVRMLARMTSTPSLAARSKTA